jgi:flagellar hook-basal body complex protein FliE
MPFFPISSITPTYPAELVESSTQSPSAPTASFSEQLKNAIAQVAHTQRNADEGALRVAAGDLADLHQAAIAMEEAKLTLQFAVQVRNKIVEAYQEISRMQV